MAYDSDNIETYQFPSLDWGNNVSEVFGFRGPKGKKGRLVDYGMMGATEAFTGAVTVAVGNAADADAYGEEFDVDGLADADQKSVASENDPIADKAAYDALMVEPDLPADTAIKVTVTGVAAAGIGTPFVKVRWDE